MNKPIIIQGALQSEIDILLKELTQKNVKEIGGYIFYECAYKDYPIIISKTKMGEISSAISTTIGIQNYNPLFIINQGTAGALVEWLNKGDIVIGKSIYYISQFSTDLYKEEESINPWKKDGYNTIDNEKISYNANQELLEYLRNLQILNKEKVYFDIIASGDVWTKEVEQIKKHNLDYGVVCEAMECSGAYMAANSFNVPLVSIRVISNNEIKNQEYDEKTSEHSQRIVLDIVKEFVDKM